MEIIPGNQEAYMVDKITFTETLRTVMEIVKTSDRPMTKEEIQIYFKDMDLSSEQEEMVYQYLLHPQEEAEKDSEEKAQEEEGAKDTGYEEGYTAEEQKHTSGAGDVMEEQESLRLSSHFQMYLDEIKEIPVLSEAEEHALFERLFQGEKEVIPSISRQWLTRVIELAVNYAGKEILLEDLVQEGNIGLLMGLNQLAEDETERTDVQDTLEQYIKEAMEAYQGEYMQEDSSENTILAKVSLVHEAARVLAKKNGTTPTLQELYEYTKIPAEEISDILALAKEAPSL